MQALCAAALVLSLPPADIKAKLGAAKPKCVYKPVMDEKDMNACGIGRH